jgi:hypothetical protein
MQVMSAPTVSDKHHGSLTVEQPWKPFPGERLHVVPNGGLIEDHSRGRPSCAGCLRSQAQQLPSHSTAMLRSNGSWILGSLRPLSVVTTWRMQLGPFPSQPLLVPFTLWSPKASPQPESVSKPAKKDAPRPATKRSHVVEMYTIGAALHDHVIAAPSAAADALGGGHGRCVLGEGPQGVGSRGETDAAVYSTSRGILAAVTHEHGAVRCARRPRARNSGAIPAARGSPADHDAVVAPALETVGTRENADFGRVADWVVPAPSADVISRAQRLELSLR